MKYDLLVLLIGAVLIIEGLPYFILPHKMRQYLEKLSLMEDRSLRLIGSFMIIIGFILVFIFKDNICN